MDKIKCITFDKASQNALPERIKAKMKADRENARRKALERYNRACCIDEAIDACNDINELS